MGIQEESKIEEVDAQGLTKRERMILDNFIRRRSEEEPESSANEEDEEEKRLGFKDEDHIDNMQLMIYGQVASEEQILGTQSKSSKKARRKRDAQKKLKAEQIAAAAAKLEAEQKAEAEEKARIAQASLVAPKIPSYPAPPMMPHNMYFPGGYPVNYNPYYHMMSNPYMNPAA